MADAYDFWAARIAQPESGAINRFWEAFAAHADLLDRTFRREDDADVAAIMQDCLGPLWSQIYWEFGPGEGTGHHLALSPELNHALRPLARALVTRAPDLPGWSFSDARPPVPLDENTVGLIEGRARMPFALSGIEAVPGEFRRIDFTGTGSGDEGSISGLAGLAFSVLFGEAVERDWLGELHAKRRGLLGSLKRAPDPQSWLPEFAAQAGAVLDELKETRPSAPLRARYREDAEVSLFTVEARDGSDDPRADMFTYSTPLPEMVQARFAGTRISVVRFSRDPESLCGVRIPRTGDHPLDDVDDRVRVTDAIQASLAADDTGGVTGEGHGKGHVYIDFATTDIVAAIARVESELGKAGMGSGCDLLFDEAGLEDKVLPLQAAGTPH